MGLVTSLFVDLTLKHESFKANLREAKESAEDFRGGVEHSFGAARGYLEAFFIIDIAEKFKEGIEKAIEYGATLNVLADRAGVTTQAFQGLRFAAGESGVSTDAFQTGMQRLVRTIGDAETGSKKATEAFEAVGISQKDLKELSPEETLKRVADALAKIEDPARRAHIEVGLLGRGGQEMDPLLRQGSAAIQEMVEHAERLGLTLSAGQADKLKELSNAGSALHESFDAALAKAFADDADGLLRLAEGAEKAVGALGKLGTFLKGADQIRDRDGAGPGFITFLGGALGLNSESYDAGTPDGQLKRDAGRIDFLKKNQNQNPIDRFFNGDNRQKLTDAVGYQQDDTLAQRGDLLMANTRPGLAADTDATTDKADKASKAMNAYASAAEAAGKMTAELETRLAGIRAGLPTDEIALLTKRTAEYADAEKKGDTPEHVATLKAAADRQYDLGEAIRKATELQKIQNDRADEFAKIVRELYKVAEEPIVLKFDDSILAPAEKRIGTAVDKINHDFLSPSTIATGREFFSSLADGIGQVVTGSAKIGDVLVQSFERAAASLVASKILELIGGIGFGGGNTLGSIFGFGGKRATGGPVEGGRTYLVGEEGAELFTAPGGGGEIMPNGALKGMGGGGISFSQTIAPNFAGNAATREEVAAMAQMAGAHAVAAVRDLRARRVPGY